jgi:hypothetical protein
MSRQLDTSQDYQNSGRRIYNVTGHGGVADMTLNQRLMDGMDLNTSKRYDQHFDSLQDHSLDHYSSRQHYATGAADLRGSMPLKRSETEHFKPNVTFASTTAPAKNHPLHYKAGGMERIDENRSGSKGSPEARKAPSSKGNVNDLSQLTIASNRLEDSIKAPNRPPMRIAGLTTYLVDSHYKKIGVYTKNS